MFKQAVSLHDAGATKQKTLSRQTTMSSSPPAPKTSQQRLNGLQLGNSVLRTSQQSALNAPFKKPTPSVSGQGIKRTHTGLQKVMGTSAFEDSGNLGSQMKPITIDENEGATHTQTAGTELFNEDDFGSDIELELEDLTTKGQLNSSATKKLTRTGATFYPTLPRQQAAPVNGSAVASGHVPPSSNPIPWSSSPPGHFESPIRGRPADVQFPSALTKPSLHADEPVKIEAKPSKKKRVLPWAAQEQEAQAEQNGPPPPVKFEHTQTPASKASLWNSTASAIKEQQKTMRENQKKKSKFTDETIRLNELVHHHTKSKGSAVARVFLSEEQQHVLDLVVQNNKSVFFTGSAGTGKSVLLREIISTLRKKHIKEPDRVAVTASTGLAACNIGGVTLHSFAGIGLGKEDVQELVKKIRRNQKAKQRWMRTKILVIDEVSMVDGDLFDKLEAIARQIRNNGRAFGGIQLVITGDFFQLPPVPEQGKPAKFAFDASAWTTTVSHTIGLHQVFRQKDPVFAGMLNEMREGRLTSSSITAFQKLCRPIESDPGDTMATELFPTRNEVERANSTRMSQLVGEVMVFEARDGGTIVDSVQRGRLLQNCMAPETIHLKKGAQVMLIKNIDEQLVNGSIGKVIGFMSEITFDQYSRRESDFMGAGGLIKEEDRTKRAMMRINENLSTTAQMYPLVRFTLADMTTRDLLCQRETWKIELPNGEVQASRSQVPLILAWALSIHKAQGQTLDRVKVDLGKVFENGQAYVALSRATSMAGLQVLRFEAKKVFAHEKVRTFYANLSRVEALGEKNEPAGSYHSAQSYERRFTGM